jgi:hypothetical protein
MHFGLNKLECSCTFLTITHWQWRIHIIYINSAAQPLLLLFWIKSLLHAWMLEYISSFLKNFLGLEVHTKQIVHACRDANILTSTGVGRIDPKGWIYSLTNTCNNKLSWGYLVEKQSLITDFDHWFFSQLRSFVLFKKLRKYHTLFATYFTIVGILNLTYFYTFVILFWIRRMIKVVRKSQQWQVFRYRWSN